MTTIERDALFNAYWHSLRSLPDNRTGTFARAVLVRVLSLLDEYPATHAPVREIIRHERSHYGDGGASPPVSDWDLERAATCDKCGVVGIPVGEGASLDGSAHELCEHTPAGVYRRGVDGIMRALARPPAGGEVRRG
jgi:hypothetical protein